MASFNSAVIARAAAALYDTQLGNASMTWALNAVDSVTYGGSVAALVQDVYNRDFKSMTYAQVAAVIVKNVGITTGAADAAAYIAGQLTAAGAGKEGTTLVGLLNAFSALTNHPVAAYNTAATAFNAQITAAVNYAAYKDTPDAIVHPAVTIGANQIFTLVAEKALGADVMHITGGMDARIDFTNPANQVRGLDLDGDGTIETNGIENVSSNFAASQRGANFEIVDAYSRNPLNHLDSANNYLGDLAFDGTGFKGDGVSTNGNVFLGGLGHDVAFGGDGNDFLAGGGIAQGHGGRDILRGGRNADFFFAEFSGIDATDGGGDLGLNTLLVDGGSTADNVSAGVSQSTQDMDWLLFEASDDDEPVLIGLDETPGVVGTPTSPDVQSRSGESMTLKDVENFDASGNLYGFLDDMNVQIGGRATDDRDAAKTADGHNYGYGSSAQLKVSGSAVANIIIGGYDNDWISGRDGNDILFGGNLAWNNNPNLAGIVNDGRDEIYGGAGADSIVFEADGGVINGDYDPAADQNYSGSDTLYLTNLSLGTKTATDMTSDNRLRFDLDAQTLANAAGFGGADVDGTQDQTNYKSGITGGRVTMTNMDSIIATGMGAIDYKAAGTNNPELLFTNQQNQKGYSGNLDLRGTSGANVLYATDGADVIEGRGGNDSLSGGDGNDDFYFGTLNGGGEAANIGDGVDVIHRQKDANGDNLWDTSASGANLYERDFNIGGSSSTGASSLVVDLGSTNLASADVAMTSFTVKIGGATFSVSDAAALIAANSAAEVAALVNTAYKAIDAKVTAVAVNNTIVVTDTGGRVISSTVAEGYAVGGVVSNGAFSALATFNPAGTTTTKDRLIYKSYEDRADNEGTDDDSFHGSAISLGTDAYAEDLVINFADEDGNGLATTRLAEDQIYKIKFTNLTTQDKVSIEVNGVKYSLQVGVDLDGNILNNEDTNSGTSQADIQKNFVARLNGFINSFMDDDTAVGAINSAVETTTLTGDTLSITQRAYNGEETVFMVKPTVTLQNLSGGEPASASVTNASQHEVELLDFDGRNGELNATNVLFVGQEFVSRATLATAKTAGQTINGSEAVVIDVGADNLQDTVFNSATVTTANNTASNSSLWNVTNGFAVHGDDFLLGGAGLDVINGGTGDDRVEGSIGGNGTTTWDVLDGGKNIYAVQVLGETQARLYVLNKWEAANPSKVTALQTLTISSIQLIDQSESGLGLISGVFDDTLQFSQRNFTAGTTRFTVVLNDFALNGTTVELRNDGAGTVGVDVDGDGTIDNWTKFTNFENIRTVSGTSNAIAGDGQGNDTLDVQLLSSTTTGAGGISYNLTNDGGAGEVRYSTDAILTTPVGGDFPVSADYESLVLKVDGVENVIASTGADLVIVDETEAAKNNTFTLGLGVDRVQYQNQYTNDSVAEPTVTIKVDNVAASVGGTDTVTMTGGRVGSTQAVDTLGGVEYIALTSGTATNTRENDVLDVTSMSAGAVVSYIDGTVKDLSGTTHVTVQGIVQLENVWADGNDKVIVADSSVMVTNARADENNATPAQNILFMTYRDFDDLNTNATTRKSFAAQVADSTITTVINQGEYTFNLSKTGTGADVDRVDYSAEDGRIVVPVGQGSATKPQYVVVDGNINGIWNDVESRVDVLRSVEEIVAAKGQSVMDFTDVGQARQITYQYNAPSGNPAENQVIEQTIRIADGSGNTIAGLNTFVEKWTYNNTTAAVADATWNRIEGSDAAEVVIYNGSEDLVNQSGLDHRFTQDVLTLRGGANEVRYSPLETSISASINVAEENTATTGTAEGLITATITFQDGKGVGAPSGTFLGGQHTITSYTSDNSTAGGSLKIEGSQDAEDVVTFTSGSQKVFLLGVSAGVLNVNIGALQTMVLTGFEFLGDAATNDVYDFKNLSNATGLKLVDNVTADHDMIKVYSDALGAGNTIDLNTLNTQWGTFDFDVLDVSGVSSNAMTTVVGDAAGTTEEVVLGALNNAGNALTASNFDSVVFTQGAVTQMGTTFTFNPTTGAIVAGAKTITAADADAISFGGLVFENSLRDGRVASVTSGITFNVSGTSGANVTVVGGSGNDTLTTAGGADTLIGGGGNDTLSGGYIAAVGPKYEVTLTGGASAYTANGDAITIGGVTITAAAVPAAFNASSASNQIITGADADQVGAMFASVSLATWQAALQTAGATAAEAGSLTSVTYDAVSNKLVFQHNNSTNASTLVIGDYATGKDLVGGTITASEAFTAFTAAVNTNDTYVFEATAAKNGVDTINNFNNGDTLDFTQFFLTSGLDVTYINANLGTASQSFTAGTDVIVKGFNKATLSASDFGTGKFVLTNNGSAVFVMTADADNTADATNDGYKVYFVKDVDPGAGITYQVDLVATVNTDVELITTLVGTTG